MTILGEITKHINSFLNGDTQEKFIEDIGNQEDVLVISGKRCTKGIYEVYDNNKNLKYIIKGKSIFSKSCFDIYNKCEKRIATVQEKERKFGLHILYDLIFKIGNKEVGIFKRKPKKKKNTYNLDNGWCIERKKLKHQYEIKNSDKIIAKISPYNEFGKLIVFNKNENELLILMVVMSIITYDIVNEKYMIKMARESGGGG